MIYGRDASCASPCVAVHRGTVRVRCTCRAMWQRTCGAQLKANKARLTECQHYRRPGPLVPLMLHKNFIFKL